MDDHGVFIVKIGGNEVAYSLSEVPTFNVLQQRLWDEYGIPTSHQILVHGNEVITQESPIILPRFLYTVTQQPPQFILFMKGTNDQNLVELCKDLRLNEPIVKLVTISLPRLIQMKINAGTTVLHMKEHIRKQTGFQEEHQLITVKILNKKKNPSLQLTKSSDFLLDLCLNERIFIEEEKTIVFDMFLDLPEWKSLYYESVNRNCFILFPTIIITLLYLDDDMVVETALPRDEIKSDSIECINQWIEQQYNIPCRNQFLLFRGKILEENFLDRITRNRYYHEPDICRLELYDTNNFPSVINLEKKSGDHHRVLLSSLSRISYKVLKIQIKNVFDIDPDDQALIHDGKVLLGDKTFFECLYNAKKNEKQCFPTIQLYVLPKRFKRVFYLENGFRILEPIQVVYVDNQPLPMNYFYTRKCTINDLIHSIRCVLSALNNKSEFQLVWNGDVIGVGDRVKLCLEMLNDSNFTEYRIELRFINNNNSNNNDGTISLLTKCSTSNEVLHVNDRILFNIIIYHPNSNNDIIFKTDTDYVSRVEDVKKQLFAEFSLDLCDQVLLFAGKILQPDQSISALVDSRFETVIPLALFLKPTSISGKYADFLSLQNMGSLRTVTVTSLTGQVTIFNVGERVIHLVKCLKFQIQKEMQVPWYLQKLMFNNEELDDQLSLMKLYLDVGDFFNDNIAVFLMVAQSSDLAIMSCYYNDGHVGPLMFSETTSMAKVKEGCIKELSDKGIIQELLPLKYFQCLNIYNRPINETSMVYNFKTSNKYFWFRIQKRVFVIVRSASSDDSSDIELDFPITDHATQTISTIRKYLMRQRVGKNNNLVLDDTSNNESYSLRTKLDDVGQTIIVFKEISNSKSSCVIS